MPKNETEEWLRSESYDYTLPAELIATKPAVPKEDARLMVIDRTKGSVTHSHIRNIQDFIPKSSAIIYNDTKVIKARLFGHKSSGGKVELLINRQLDATFYSVFIKGRVKKGSTLYFEEGLEAEVVELKEDGSRVVVFKDSNKNTLVFETLLPYLDKIGHMPLPPYIRRKESKTDTIDYQPVFARKEGAVAAPTASLHFSDTLFGQIKERHDAYPITLHVGAGTFKPVEAKIITDHPMHSEYYDIPPETAFVIDSDREILAIGTTVTRTIEYYVRTNRRFGECDLFLHPGNPPRRVDHLMTNFHLPKSTLIMLVASFLGMDMTKKVYNEAIKEHYRFYSYGDAMLIL